MSLATGVAAGSRFLGTMESIKASKQNRELREEEQKEIRRKREEAEAIRKAGLEAMQDEASNAMQPVPVQAMPPAAAQAQAAAPAAAMEPVATATPVAAPGSGAAPSGENLTMEPVTQGAPAAALPPYEAPRHHPPPPGSTIAPEEVPSMAALRAPSAPSSVGGASRATGGAPPAMRGVAPGAMPQARSPDDLDRINQVLMAQSRKAAELGRADLAYQYHVQGMQVRDQLRGRALDQAEQQFRTTGDVNAFVPVFNRFISNGTTIDSLQKQQDGSYALAGHTDDGKQFQQNLSAGQMQQYLTYLRDPKVARALEAKRAEEIRKNAQDIRLEQVKATGKDRFQSVPAGGTLVDTQTGDSFTAPKDRAGAFDIVKGENGEFVRFNKDTGASELLFGRTPDGRQLPKQVTAMQKDAANAVFKANGTDSDMFESLDENKKAKLMTQVENAADLVAANYGTDNWRGMSHAKAASIAQAIEDGRARIVQIKLPNQEQPVRGVVYEGRKYLLDPNVGGGSGGQAAFNNSPTVKQSAGKAGQRASDRKQILETEMERAFERRAVAKTPAERERAQKDLEMIARELGVAVPEPEPADAMPRLEQLPIPRQQTGIGTTQVSGRIS